MSPTSQHIAIIGAGLSGLALSLSLHQQGIKSTIYESRPSPLNIGGAVMLSPNALRILDTLGLYNLVKNQGYNFNSLEFITTSGELIDSYEFGNEAKYGYSGNRIYRYELIDIIINAVRAAGVEVVYGRKFSHVVEETSDSVTFAFSDNTTITATMLIGADGIHSTVRKHMYPGPEHAPKFIGHAGITASVPTTNLPPDTKARPLTIMTKSSGAFVLAPQKVDGSELLIGKQKRITGNPTREEWDAIHADKAASIAFLKENNEVFGPIAISATSHIPADNINVWPFYVVPKLENWASGKKRVVLVGDAAHAIPPSAGQGINQAFEDVFMLALLIARVASDEEKLAKALDFWQSFRQERIAGVLKVNARVDQRRLPRELKEGDEEVEIEKEGWELGWLYDVDIPRVVDGWFAEQGEKA